MNQKPLTDIDRATYEWQMWAEEFGARGQRALKNSTVLISRVGGLGSVVAYELAAAGVGKLILAHKGNVKHSDLNRQLLMTYDWLGKPRVESAKRRLNELNPFLKIEAIEENMTEQNAKRIVSKADLIVDCAPLFEERFAMNRQAVLQKKPLIECAMFELDAQITSIQPGATPCLQCLHPEKPAQWKRQFPVFGAVSGTVGCLGAMEAIKIIAEFGKPLYNQLLAMDLRTMRFRRIELSRNPNCPVCSACISNQGAV